MGLQTHVTVTYGVSNKDQAELEGRYSQTGVWERDNRAEEKQRLKTVESV